MREAMLVRVIVIGNNVAGTTVAKAMRDADPAVSIDIYSQESVPYYPRPRLIDYLEGKVQEKDVPFYPLDWYQTNRLGLYLDCTVERIDRSEKRIQVQGMWERYDKLVLATGSSAFVPPFLGLPKENVFTLKTLPDAKKIKERASRSKRVIVIGGGLLGLETGRALCSAFPELHITILESGEHILMRQLDHEGAQMLQSWIEETGALVSARSETERILGDGADAEGVLLKDGRRIDGDMVVISAGTRPNLQLAKDAGLKVNKGIVVDTSLRTSDPDIYALGDVAEFNGQVWAMIPPALDEARIAAKKILGQPTPDYAGTVPSNTLKVAGFELTSIGTVRSVHEPPEPGIDEIRTTTPDGKIYKKFVLKDGKMIGAILLGTKKEVVKVTKFIKEGTPIEDIKDRLRDPSYTFN
jgi:nitrite reductase (NADH) large subunit